VKVSSRAATKTGESDGGAAAVLSPERREEFERLVMAHLDSAYSGALRLTRNKTDAEDLVQDAVVRAMRGFHRFQSDTNFKAWLFRIMTNLYINEYHRRARRPERAEEVEPADLGWPGLPADPEMQVLRRMEAQYLHQAIEGLPAEFRAVVMLADEQGFSYEEIAKMIKRPIGTVRSRLHRGRRMLMHRLYDYAREAGYR